MSSPSGSKSGSILDFAESSVASKFTSNVKTPSPANCTFHQDKRPAMKYIGPAGTHKPLTESQIGELRSQGKGEVVILPTAPSKAIFFPLALSLPIHKISQHHAHPLHQTGRLGSELPMC